GGTTIVHLQWLINQGHFGPDAHPDMILSITSVSSPFRGTQIVYSLGESVRDAPAIRFFSPGNVAAKVIHLCTYFAPLGMYIPFFGNLLPDLHTESRSLSYREIGLIGLIHQLWKSDWAEGRDATPFDVTFAGSDEREHAGWGDIMNLRGSGTRTWFKSYVAQLTERDPTSTAHTPPASQAWNPLYLTSRLISSFDFTLLRPTPSFVQGCAVVHGTPNGGLLPEEYRANDGIVPVFSQWHPGKCSPRHCIHYASPNTATPVIVPSDTPLHSPLKKDRHPEPGIYHVHSLPSSTHTHHTSVVPFWAGTDCQKTFWVELGHWLRDVEIARWTSPSPEEV
ncbi:hypothetical protein FRB99_007248, partial [Tulasnella sp. 403]